CNYLPLINMCQVMSTLINMKFRARKTFPDRAGDMERFADATTRRERRFRESASGFRDPSEAHTRDGAGRDYLRGGSLALEQTAHPSLGIACPRALCRPVSNDRMFN